MDQKAVENVISTHIGSEEATLVAGLQFSISGLKLDEDDDLKKIVKDSLKPPEEWINENLSVMVGNLGKSSDS